MLFTNKLNIVIVAKSVWFKWNNTLQTVLLYEKYTFGSRRLCCSTSCVVLRVKGTQVNICDFKCNYTVTFTVHKKQLP